MKNFKYLLSLTILFQTLTISAIGADPIERDGRMYLETRDGQWVEMQVGIKFIRSMGQSLPSTPSGTVWIKTAVSSGGFAEHYELISEEDPRLYNQRTYEALTMIDELRHPIDGYNLEQRTNMIFDTLRELGYSRNDSRILSRRLTDSRNKNKTTESIVAKFNDAVGCVDYLTRRVAGHSLR